MMSNGNIFMAEQWYQFVLEQPIFQNCSTANRSVLQRLEPKLGIFRFVLRHTAKSIQETNDLRFE